MRQTLEVGEIGTWPANGYFFYYLQGDGPIRVRLIQNEGESEAPATLLPGQGIDSAVRFNVMEIENLHSSAQNIDIDVRRSRFVDNRTDNKLTVETGQADGDPLKVQVVGEGQGGVTEVASANITSDRGGQFFSQPIEENTGSTGENMSLCLHNGTAEGRVIVLRRFDVCISNLSAPNFLNRVCYAYISKNGTPSGTIWDKVSSKDLSGASPEAMRIFGSKSGQGSVQVGTINFPIREHGSDASGTYWGSDYVPLIGLRDAPIVINPGENISIYATNVSTTDDGNSRASLAGIVEWEEVAVV